VCVCVCACVCVCVCVSLPPRSLWVLQSSQLLNQISTRTKYYAVAPPPPQPLWVPRSPGPYGAHQPGADTHTTPRQGRGGGGEGAGLGPSSTREHTGFHKEKPLQTSPSPESPGNSAGSIVHCLLPGPPLSSDNRVERVGPGQ
jgi:hypothetical protein